MVERVPHVQRLCAHRSRLGSVSSCGPLLHVIPLLIISFPVSLKAQKTKKTNKNNSTEIRKYRQRAERDIGKFLPSVMSLLEEILHS